MRPVYDWMPVVACLLLAGLPAAAQDGDTGTAPPVGVRHIYVPADEPDVWPDGDWSAVASDELAGLLKQPHSPGPAPAYLETAVYRARFSGTSLVAGRFDAVARLRNSTQRYVDLGQPSMMLTDLRWSGTPAIWGLAGNNRNLLRIESDGESLSGRWSLAGRPVFSSVEFTMVVPPATVSRLELDLPDARQLDVEGGLISSVVPARRSGWRTWSVDLGRRTSCVLRVSSDGSSSPSGTRDLQVSQIATYSYVADALRLQTDITVQSISGRFDEFEVTVPKPLKRPSVTIGNETVLPAIIRHEQQRSVLAIDVRDVALARGSRIRVRGELPLRTGVSQGLPKMGLRGGRWLDIRRQVRIVSPLQLKDIEPTESLLVNSSIGIDSGAALEFDDLAPSSRMRLTVDAPQPELSASVLSRVEWGQADPLMQSDLSLHAQTGSTYELVCDVPADWEVTRIESASAMPVAQWRTTWDDDSRRHRLHIELRNALSPQNPVRISVFARQREALMTDSVEVPVVLPLVSGERRIAVVVTPPGGMRLRPGDESDYREIELADLVSQRPELGEEFTDVADAGLLVLQATDPSGHQLLQALSSARDPEVPRGARDSAVAGVQADVESIEVADALVDSVAAVWGPLEISTVVAVERGQLCRNRAVLHVASRPSPRTLTLDLDNTARLLSAHCSDPLQITGRTIAVHLRASAEPTEIVLNYESPLSPSILSGRATVPLPQWDGGATTVGWQIELPPGFRISQPTDGTTAVAEPRLPWVLRVLGPLGRLEPASPFWALGGSSVQIEEETSEGQASDVFISHRSLASDTPTLRLTYWNTTAAWQLGWVVMAASLLLTAWPFQQERLLRPSWSLRMAAIGLAAALLSPEMLAIPWGGFVMGATLGALVPQRWRRPRTRRAQQQASTSSARIPLPLTVTSGVLLICILCNPFPCRGWQLSPPSVPTLVVPDPQVETLDVLVPVDEGAAPQERLPPIVYINRAVFRQVVGNQIAQSPNYLLRSAAYVVDDFAAPRPALTAQYDVVLLRPQSETRVIIDLADVHFPDAAICRVDGELAPLLPRRDGSGVVVVVPPVDLDTESAKTAPQVRIELTCHSRPTIGESGPTLDVGIPAIIDSQVRFQSVDPAATSIQVVHAGAVSRPNAEGEWRVGLGGQGRLTAHPLSSDLAQRWLTPVEAASVIDIHPMRLQIESRLTFQTHAQWSRLDARTLNLQLPSRSIVRSIRASGLEQSQILANGRNPVLVNLAFDEVRRADVSVDISFDLPASGPGNDGLMSIPPLEFLPARTTAGFPIHRVGVAPAPGFHMDVVDHEGILTGTTEIDESRLPAWRGVRAARTSEAIYQLELPRSLEIQLSVIAPSVSSSVRQTLTASKSIIEWSATIELNVRDAPVALHRLNIDPRVSVRQVGIAQDTVERLASWSRTAPNQLVLFLKEELGGPQTVRVRGTLNVEDRHDFAIPHLSVDAASLAEPAEVVIRLADDVEMHVATDDGTVIASSSGQSASDGGTRPLATVNLDPTLPPLRLQRRPDATLPVVHQVIILQAVEEQQVVWQQLIRIEPPVLNKTILLEVAPVSEPIELSTTVPTMQSIDGDAATWELNLADIGSEPVDVTISGRTPLALGALPQVRVHDSPLPVHRAVVLEGFTADVRGAREFTPGLQELPEWVQSPISGLTRPVARVLTIEDPGFPLHVQEESAADPRLLRFDSAVWPQASGRRRGVTVVDLAAGREATVDFAIPAGMTLQRVQVDGAESRFESPDAYSVQVNPSEDPQQVTLWWTDADADGSVPLPGPVHLSGAAARVVYFGNRQRFYDFGDAENVDAGQMLTEFETMEVSGSVASPIARALRDAGATTAPARARAAVHALRLADGSSVLPVKVVDRQIIRFVWLIVTAGAALLVWFVLGRWGDRLGRLSQQADGLPVLICLAAIIWMLGGSWLALAMFIAFCGAWLIEARQSAAG